MLDKDKALRIEYNKDSRTRTFVFKCKNCDSEIRSQQTQLKTHSGKCRNCSQKKEPYKHIYNELKKTCSKKGRETEFNISFEYFLNLIKDNFCTYCGTELVYNKHTRSQNGEPVSRAHQLDRKDSNKGYIEGNLTPCCWECNRLKSNRFTYEEFMKLSPVLKEIMRKREKL